MTTKLLRRDVRMKGKLLAQEFFAVFFFFFFCKNRGNAILLGYRPSWRKPLLPGRDCCRIFTAGKAIGKRRRVGSDDEYHLVITEMAMRFTFRSTSNLAHIQQLTVSELAPVLKQHKCVCVCCFGRRRRRKLSLSLSACHLLSLSLSEIKTKERERRWWKPFVAVEQQMDRCQSFYCFLGQRLKENKRERELLLGPLMDCRRGGFLF